jgi:MHS family proline/betaine transporter-like MFS transporter
MNRKHFEYGTLPVSSSLDTEDDPSSSITHHDHHHQRFFGYLIRSPDSEQIRTFLNITTNILEWYAFAIFGYLSDVLGAVFFPAYDSHGNPTSPNTVLIQSFAVFGGAFFVRPFGGLAFGYLGDVYGRPLALISSILLMGVSTIGMACLPTYQHMGKWSTIGLIVVRLLQGFSAGGQLMSSLVFGVESRPAHQWGFYGAFVVAAANLGTLLAGASVSVLRQQVAPQTLETWGWRIPNFVAGVFLLVLGYLLKHYSPAPAAGLQEDEDQDRATTSTAATATGVRTTSHDSVPRIIPTRENPLRLAFAAGNRRSLLAACMVPVLGSSGFYLTFVWSKCGLFFRSKRNPRCCFCS